jgi:hypothetical protein
VALSEAETRTCSLCPRQLARYRRPTFHPLPATSWLLGRPWEDPNRQVCHLFELLPQSSSSRRVYGDESAYAGGGLRRYSIRYTSSQSGMLCSSQEKTCLGMYRWSPKPSVSSCEHGWYDVVTHAHCGSRRDTQRMSGTSVVTLCETEFWNSRRTSVKYLA